MKRLAELYVALDETNRTSEKLAALSRYFADAPPADAAWAVYVLSGRKIGKGISGTMLRQWAAEVSGLPLWLIDQCHVTVGDLSETLALLLPKTSDGNAAPPLHEVIEQRLRILGKVTRQTQRQLIVGSWNEMNANQRLVFHKLLSGEFRVGVSRQLMIRALAEVAKVEPAIIAHRLSGHWEPTPAAMRELLSPHDATAAPHPAAPYPFMLAHALHAPLSTLGPIGDWLLEWKWDGIRAQIIRRQGQVTLWSRGDERVEHTFPEITHAAALLPDGVVLDGEIVAWNVAENRPLPFIRLQRRLNRLSFEPTFWPEIPVTFVAFDALEIGGRDIRSLALRERRAQLADLIPDAQADAPLRLSMNPRVDSWESAAEQIADARRRGVEGLMLKRLDSEYLPGRPTGLWWKLKVEPFTVDAVMIAAEPGHGRRAGLLTDYTFGVWSNDALVPIAKAYSGLTDLEIAEVDRFARRHTTARHGPVHAVEPLMVFEIGFEAIAPSKRHKSGLAVRFPRILRIRKDKTPAEADQLTTLQALIEQLRTLR